ncbi:hypothetical protein [Kitasatospora purpeofusca]|uniref:hypothetical protein n=1 Tax=Kitasatospora purpeofusca TaxID=67352 RepID=UPI002A5B05EA|nr:hypothetical protein [Kitasatospora purpeofusca]MDY0816559.1 hypothetical protein [Kitasatospora purpeofusca]
MPRPDWIQMSPTAWYGGGKGKQDALFAPPGDDPDIDDFGTAPFDGCTVEELESTDMP